MLAIPEEVVRRFAYKNDLPFSSSLELFTELELFLDASANKAASPARDVDAAWHEFILHTLLYEKYCHNRYGKFIHHIPTSPVSCETLECSTGEGHRVTEHTVEAAAYCSSDCSSCRTDVRDLVATQ